MYDCQQDSYADFATTPTSRRNTPSLSGELQAIPLHDQASAQLTQLLAWACERDLPARLQNNQLDLSGVNIEQALQINRLFGKALIISCHLRRQSV